MRKLLLVALTALFVLTPSLTSSRVAEAADGPLALAFYYAWFDENSWNPATLPDLPSQPYASRDRATIERHVSQAQAAGIDAFVQSWWGPGNPTEDNFKTLLDVAQAKGFRAAIDFEVSSPFYGNRAAVVNGLRHLIQTHTSHPAYLRWNGRPVIFFWRQQQYGAAEWTAIRNEVDPNRSTIWIAEGTDTAFLAQFDGHHMYSVAWDATPADQLVKMGNWVRGVEGRWGDKLWVATVMPGYDDTRLGRSAGFRRDRVNGGYFRETFRGARESNADWVVITSFNEWPEGTYIEPSHAYGDFYLNLTRDLIAEWKGGAAVASQPPAAPAPAPAPPSGAQDWAVPGGRFFTQTAGGQGGFRVVDDGEARFWSEFQRLGGLQTVGYPISQRFTYDGFVTQAFQKLVLQWRPEANQAWPVNVFDELARNGHNTRLNEARQTPYPLADGFDAPGAAWEQVVVGRQALLNGNAALRARYFSVGDPLTVFGLPTSRVEDMGNHWAVRTQRAVFQQWKEAVPWAAAGQVTIANGGDIAKELGWLPGSATQPEPVQ